MSRGALNNKPKFQLGGSYDELMAQQQRIQGRIDKRGGDNPRLQKRLTKVQGALANTPQPSMPGSPEDDIIRIDDVSGRSNDYMDQLFNRFNEQGAFNPNLPELNTPDQYEAMRRQAEDRAMSAFSRQMEPRFQQEEARLREQLVQQGLPENSELYQRQMQELRQSQNQARQSAYDSAFQAGQGEQAQMYGQGMQTRGQMFNEQFQGYQLPMAQMNTMMPFYQQQMQNDQFNRNMTWQEQQAQLDRDFQERMARLGNKFERQNMRLASSLTPRGGGGGGGGAPPDPYAMERQMINGMINQGYGTYGQQQYPSPGSNFAQGFVGGAGSFIGSTLK